MSDSNSIPWKIELYLLFACSFFNRFDKIFEPFMINNQYMFSM
jgi:hypothetical protein